MTGKVLQNPQGGRKAALRIPGNGIRVTTWPVAVLAVLVSLLGHDVSRAASTQVVAQATVVSNNTCAFLTGGSALNFGTLDPASAADVSTSANVYFFCWGTDPNVTFYVSDNDGLYSGGTGSHRMRHSTSSTEYLPYSLGFNPLSGTVRRFTFQNLTITGTVRAADYRDALAGTYSDRVVVTLLP
jgi:spore coat protein U-like protein